MNQRVTFHSDLSSRSVDSPVGPLTIVASADGLRAVLWPDDDARRVPSAAMPPGSAESNDAEQAAEREGVEPETSELDTSELDTSELERAERVLDAAQVQLEEYFAGERVDFDVSLDPVGTEFQHSAWTALRSIPFGETVSYGEQAERLGDKKKARAVGAANGKNPISIIVPCHRVVGANGSLTGFAGGVDIKQWLLAHEQRVAGNTLL